MKRLTNDLPLGMQDQSILPSYEEIYKKLRQYEFTEEQKEQILKNNKII